MDTTQTFNQSLKKKMQSRSNPCRSSFLFASIPAKLIDALILYSPKTGITQSAKRVAARALSLTVSVTALPALMSIDFIRYSTKSVLQYIRSRACGGTSTTKAQIQLEVQRNKEVALKCLQGIICSPLGIVWRDVVSNHFLPEPTEDDDRKIRPTGGLYESGAHIYFPETLEQVQSLLTKATDENRKVSIAGAGFSQGKQTLPPDDTDIHINMKKMNRVVIDPDKRVAVVGAGATWSDIQNQADRHGLAVKVMQASNVFSVGGSLSANCHGWDHTEGCVGNTVNVMVVVDARGKVHKITPKDEYFKYVVGGYGLFGVIVEVELNLAPNEELLEYAQRVAIDEYHDYFKKTVQQNPKLKMHIYRLSLESEKLLTNGWAQNYSSVSPECCVSVDLMDESKKGTRVNKVMMQVARNSPYARTEWWRREEKKLTRMRKDTRNKFMRPVINAAFANNSCAHREWLQEYFVPGTKLCEFIHFLADTLNTNEVALMNASVRFVHQDVLAVMGYATKGDCFAIVLFFNQHLHPDEIKRTKMWVRKVTDKLNTIGGTFYLPYMHFVTKEQFRKSYPQWKQVAKKKQQFDPDMRFDNGLFQDYFVEKTTTSTFIADMYKHSDSKDTKGSSYREHINSPKLKAFLSNVFKQVDVDKFMSIYSECATTHNRAKDVYKLLLERAVEAKGGLWSKTRMGLCALRGERDTLAQNVARVMDPNRKRDGYVEIGMPGRMIKVLAPKMGLSGKITVVNEHESLVQSGFPRPYATFQKLTYDPLTLEKNSVDVISMFAGLHHCPGEKMDAFVKSVHETLRDGGIFLLREHDARDHEMLKLAHIIHSVFNAATGVPVEAEMKEVRNFKSLDEWTKILEGSGFRCVSRPLIRKGDSTENTLLKFVKIDSSKTCSAIDVVREKLISRLQSSYTRPQEQTFLTTVEWFNVESSKHLGRYENVWDYPFWRDVGELGKALYKSVNASRAVIPLRKLVVSEYGFMNGMLTAMMSVEYVVKGLVSLPARALSKAAGLLPEHKVDRVWELPAKQYQKWNVEYGVKLDKTPYYAQRYLPGIKSYWRGFSISFHQARQRRNVFDLIFDRQTVKNVATGVAMTADLLARSVVATFSNYFMGGEAAGDDRSIGLIVKGNVSPSSSLTALDVVVKDKHSFYKGITAPRYKELERVLKKLINSGVEIIEIAGQTEIQIDILVDKDTNRSGAEKLYERAYLKDGTKKIVALKINVSDFAAYFDQEEVHRVCDF